MNQEDSNSSDDFEVNRARMKMPPSRRKSTTTLNAANMETDDEELSSEGVHCQLCEKYFNNHKDLVEHLYKHAPTNPTTVSESEESEEETSFGFECDICHLEFCDENEGRIHLLKHHRDELKNEGSNPDSSVKQNKAKESVKPTKTFMCKLCRMVFPSRYFANIHRYKKHSEYKNQRIIDEVDIIPKSNRNKTTNNISRSPKKRRSQDEISTSEYEKYLIKIPKQQSGERRQSIPHLKTAGISKKSLAPEEFKDKVSNKENRKRKSNDEDKAASIKRRRATAPAETNKPTLYLCSQCNLHFDSIPALRRHDTNCQELVGNICSTCHLRFPTEKLLQHTVNHHRNDNKHIDFCIVQVKSSKLNKKHILYKCGLCDDHFLNETAFYSHAFKRKNSNHTNEGILCEICQISFPKISYNKHTFVHHDILGLQKTDFVVEVMNKGNIPENSRSNESKKKTDQRETINRRLDIDKPEDDLQNGQQYSDSDDYSDVPPDDDVSESTEDDNNGGSNHKRTNLPAMTSKKGIPFSVTKTKTNSTSDAKKASSKSIFKSLSCKCITCNNNLSTFEEREQAICKICTKKVQASRSTRSNPIDAQIPSISTSGSVQNADNNNSSTSDAKKASSKSIFKSLSCKCITCNNNLSTFEEREQAICKICTKKVQASRSTRSNPIDAQIPSISTSGSVQNADNNNSEYYLFKCSNTQCDIHFDTDKALRQHTTLQLCDSEVKSLCITCDKYFSSSNSLTRHENRYHKRLQLSYSDFKVVTESEWGVIKERLSAENTQKANTPSKRSTERVDEEDRLPPKGVRPEESNKRTDTHPSNVHNDKQRGIDISKDNKPKDTGIERKLPPHSKPKVVNTPKEHSGTIEKKKTNLNKPVLQSKQDKLKQKITIISNEKINPSQANSSKIKYSYKIPLKSTEQTANDSEKNKTLDENKKTSDEQQSSNNKTSPNFKEDIVRGIAANRPHEEGSQVPNSGKSLNVLDSILKEMGPVKPNFVTDIRVEPSKVPNVLPTSISISPAQSIKHSNQTVTQALTPHNPVIHNMHGVKDPRLYNSGNRPSTSNYIPYTGAKSPLTSTTPMPYNANYYQSYQAVNTSTAYTWQRPKSYNNYNVDSRNLNNVIDVNTKRPARITDRRKTTDWTTDANTFQPQDVYDTNHNQQNYVNTTRPNRITARRQTTEVRSDESSLNRQPQQTKFRSDTVPNRERSDSSLEHPRREKTDIYSQTSNTRNYPENSVDKRSYQRSESRSNSPDARMYDVSKPRYSDLRPNYERFSSERDGNKTYQPRSYDRDHPIDDYRKKQYRVDYCGNERRHIRSDGSNRSSHSDGSYEKRKVHFFKCSKCRIYFLNKVDCESHVTIHPSSICWKDLYEECSTCFLKIDFYRIKEHKKSHDNNEYNQRYVNVTECSLNEFGKYTEIEHYVMDLEVVDNNKSRKRHSKRESDRKEKRLKTNDKEDTRKGLKIKQKDILKDNSKDTSKVDNNSNPVESSIDNANISIITNKTNQQTDKLVDPAFCLDQYTLNQYQSTSHKDSTNNNLDQTIKSNESVNETEFTGTSSGLESVLIEAVKTVSNENVKEKIVENFNNKTKTGEILECSNTPHSDSATIENNIEPTISKRCEPMSQSHDVQNQVNVIKNEDNNNALSTDHPVANGTDMSLDIRVEVQDINQIDIKYELETKSTEIKDETVVSEDTKITIEPPNLEDDDTLHLDDLSESQIKSELVNSEDEGNTSTDDRNIIQNCLETARHFRIEMNSRVDIDLATTQTIVTIEKNNEPINGINTILQPHNVEELENNAPDSYSESNSQEETVHNIEKYLNKLQSSENPNKELNQTDTLCNEDHSDITSKDQQFHVASEDVDTDNNKKFEHNNHENNRNPAEINSDNILNNKATEAETILTSTDQELIRHETTEHLLKEIDSSLERDYTYIVTNNPLTITGNDQNKNSHLIGFSEADTSSHSEKPVAGGVSNVPINVIVTDVAIKDKFDYNTVSFVHATKGAADNKAQIAPKAVKITRRRKTINIIIEELAKKNEHLEEVVKSAGKMSPRRHDRHRTDSECIDEYDHNLIMPSESIDIEPVCSEHTDIIKESKTLNSEESVAEINNEKDSVADPENDVTDTKKNKEIFFDDLPENNLSDTFATIPIETASLQNNKNVIQSTTSVNENKSTNIKEITDINNGSKSIVELENDATYTHSRHISDTAALENNENVIQSTSASENEEVTDTYTDKKCANEHSDNGVIDTHLPIETNIIENKTSSNEEVTDIYNEKQSIAETENDVTETAFENNVNVIQSTTSVNENKTSSNEEITDINNKNKSVAELENDATHKHSRHIPETAALENNENVIQSTSASENEEVTDTYTDEKCANEHSDNGVVDTNLPIETNIIENKTSSNEEVTDNYNEKESVVEPENYVTVTAFENNENVIQSPTSVNENKTSNNEEITDINNEKKSVAKPENDITNTHPRHIPDTAPLEINENIIQSTSASVNEKVTDTNTDKESANEQSDNGEIDTHLPIETNIENKTSNAVISADAASDDDVVFVQTQEVIYYISDDENETVDIKPKVEKYLNVVLPENKQRKTRIRQTDMRKFMCMKQEKTDKGMKCTDKPLANDANIQLENDRETNGNGRSIVEITESIEKNSDRIAEANKQFVDFKRLSNKGVVSLINDKNKSNSFMNAETPIVQSQFFQRMSEATEVIEIDSD